MIPEHVAAMIGRVKLLTLPAGLVTLALVALPAPAHAASRPDPVKAVKAQFAQGKGVRFTERTTLYGAKTLKWMRTRGTFLFGRNGTIASRTDAAFDYHPVTASQTQLTADLFSATTTIQIGSTCYTHGGVYRHTLPEGKTWFKNGSCDSSEPPFFGQPLDVTEPKTLAAMIKAAKWTGGVYEGKLTYKRLRSLSPWFRAVMPFVWNTKGEFTYVLTVRSNGLPDILLTSFDALTIFDSSDWANETFEVETHYTGWGKRVPAIKPPPASKVTTETTDS